MSIKDYGMTDAEYDQLLEYQGGGCAICGRPPKTKRLDTDHDHQTGLLRGLLCFPCNRLLIGRHTDWRLFREAAWYLRKPPAGKLFRPPKRHKNAATVRENDND